jgi:hypothetical protein
MFCLYRNSDKAVAVKLRAVNHEMCAHFGEKPNGMGYYFYWDEVIASRLARGEEFDKIRAYFVERRDHCASSVGLKARECHRNYGRLIEIIDWLAQNFTPDAATGAPVAAGSHGSSNRQNVLALADSLRATGVRRLLVRHEHGANHSIGDEPDFPDRREENSSYRCTFAETQVVDVASK